MSEEKFRVGDRVVVVQPRYYGDQLTCRQVKSVSSRYVELDDNSRWGHDDRPYPKTKGYDRPRIEHETQEHLNTIERHEVLRGFTIAVGAVEDRLSRGTHRVTSPNEDIRAAVAALRKLAWEKR